MEVDVLVCTVAKRLQMRQPLFWSKALREALNGSRRPRALLLGGAYAATYVDAGFHAAFMAILLTCWPLHVSIPSETHP